MTERAHDLREVARSAVAATALVGSIALSGCTDGPKPQEAHPPAVTYNAPPGADELPLVSSQESHLAEPSADRHVDAGMLAYGKNPNDFGWHDNIPPDENHPVRHLPGTKSAPVLDIMIGSDGNLRYKDYDEKKLSQEELGILSAVSAASPVVSAGFRTGQVRQLHFRVHQPHQFPANPTWEPSASMQFAPHDYTKGGNGESAVYYYFAARGSYDTEALSRMIRHEFMHAMTGQSEIAPPLSPEQQAAFSEACTTLRASALANMQQDSSSILMSLNRLQRLAPQAYGPAFEAVRKSLQDGTYAQLPSSDRDATQGIPECFLQDPWRALAQTIRSKGINGGAIPPEMTTEDFKNEVDDMVEDWHDLIKENAVYRALSESTYVSKQGDNKELGHPYEDIGELQASTMNLMLSVPEEFGQHVADLPDAQRSAVQTVIEQGVKILKEHNKNDEVFLKYLDGQYALYTKRLNVHSG